MPEDDPIARLKAGLDAAEAAARRELLSYAGPPGRRKAAEHMLRIVAAHREILAMHKTDIDPADAWYGSNARCEECGTYVMLTGPCKTLRILAAIYDSSGGSRSTT